MGESNALIRELELAVSQGEGDRRLAALSYTTDLLITGRYDDDEIWMFGEVIGLLASEIEASARAELANRLAHSANAPVRVMDKLASDDAISIAGPVLRHSERLSPGTVVRNAHSKSQEHLLAIAQRRSLPEDVTDVLVARGNREVVHSVAKNGGARFSDSGFWKLVQRCENDVVLTLEVGARKDIPRHHFQKLIAKASDEVKSKLAAINPNAESEVCDVVTDIAGAFQAKFGPATRSYYIAKKQIGEMHRFGELTEEALCKFARARKFEEIVVALSLLCDLPVSIVELALHDDQGEMILIIAKAAKFAWPTTRLLILLRAGDGLSAHDLDEALRNFSLLSVTTARQVMDFYRSRQETGSSTKLTPA